MPFLGNQPQQGFANSVVKDDFTPNGSTTAFTLSKSAGSANDIEVYVGNVRQEPTDAYTVSGTTLTMSEAVASGMNFYVLHVQGTVQSSIAPQSNSVGTGIIQNNAVTTAKIVNDAVTSAKIPSNAITNAQLAGGITSAKFASNAISEQTAGENILTQKFYYTNVSPNAQPINTSFTLSATEAPLGSWVALRTEVLCGSSAGDQYCYVYQQGGTGFTTAVYVGNDWYYYSIISTLFPIRDAADRTFNVTHGTIAHSSSGDFRKVWYMGYWKVTA